MGGGDQVYSDRRMVTFGGNHCVVHTDIEL